MSLHLFATPTQCTNCGTVVDDPTTERCPKCGNLLKERRTPRRLAGLEERYRSIRVLLGVLRFLAVMVLVVGGIAFFGALGDPETTFPQNLMMLMMTVMGAVGMFALAAFFSLAMDVEENTRASFRLQQMLLDELGESRRGPAPTGDAAAPSADGRTAGR